MASKKVRTIGQAQSEDSRGAGLLAAVRLITVILSVVGDVTRMWELM